MIQNLSNGGAERAITLLANTLKDEYNVKMVVFDNSIKEYVPEVEIIDLEIPESNNMLKKICNVFVRAKKVKKLKKKLNIDYTISYLSGPNLVNCLSKYKDKTIISIRNMQSKLKKNKFRDIVNQMALKRADQIVAVSEAVKKDTEKRYKTDRNKIFTIPNMINIDEIRKMQKDKIEEKNIFDNQDIKIINIGRLIFQKGQWHLIKAFKDVNKKYPNAKLVILGRGELEKDLKKLIGKLELNNNVYLLDFKTNPYKYLSNSDIFVSTSLYEGMSNVILEAMACDLPIIATDCEGGTKEILKDKYGILIPSFDEDYDITEKVTEQEKELAKIIIDLIEDKQERERYKEMSKIRIQDFLDEKIKQKWMDIF